ncbi:ribonucleotide-diphosphate reductase subunit beta [Corallococcus exiguus]|uniref:ribonucleotide-diphosphate reductase subunit beta n=1 Tax=Corallococcus TaxID=83461 RepID=UPI000EC73167|nr:MULTISPECIES: ribonucleotide-diphosphate reductase subunit beta [Corallococcus]NPC74918.1 ribonucleotide-diphosphate reductase subunit beta [Corallococcus exiguus]NRD48661.1 ribonucleotide-diphosphate reductase subunit beta [Corallococcus exiguus]RKH98130.1 ribonucleoside-diphosphate reductase [Corallococcus sp. AB038B]
MLLDPGMNLTLRPMAYPVFFEMYRNAIKNTWTVEEIDFSTDLVDLRSKMTDAERHLIHRLVAFFATGDSIVGNNLVLNLYKHLNAPEARMYLSRQLYEEALHVQFYLTLLDSYVPDPAERAKAFAAVDNIPSIQRKARFCMKWMDSIQALDQVRSKSDRRQFLLNLICFAGCIEGLFFFAAFAYVYFLRSKGLLNGLAAGTNWVFRDESAHMTFAFEAIKTARKEEPDLFDAGLEKEVVQMMRDAVECETQFAQDLLSGGVMGLSVQEMRGYLEYVADQRLQMLGIAPVFHTKNPLHFMDLQDVQELTNFFERRVSSYQVAVGVGAANDVVFDAAF